MAAGRERGKSAPSELKVQEEESTKNPRKVDFTTADTKLQTIQNT